MSRGDQHKIMRIEREGLIKELEILYRKYFDRLGTLDLKEGDVAKLAQLFLNSQEAAITPLKEKIEEPILTKAPY